MMLSKQTVTTNMDSSPLLVKSKEIETKIPAIEEVTVEDEVHLPDAADDSGTEEASAKQGTAEKKTTAPKRKATPTGETAEPAAKKQRAAPKKQATPKKETTLKKKATPKKTATAPRRRPKKEDWCPETEPPPPPPPPLSVALKRKLAAINTFFDTHPARLLNSEAGCHVTSVDELDLLAALIILRVHYQLEYNTVSDASFEDAGEMIVDRPPDGKLSVDFNKRCEIERAVQAKLADRETRMETVNLLEVEIDMLVAKRKQLAEDEMPAVGFRVYAVDDAATDHDEGGTVEKVAAEDIALATVAVAEDELGDKVVDDGIVVDAEAVEEYSMEKQIVNAIADEEESVHEKEQEAVGEHNPSDEASEDESEEE